MGLLGVPLARQQGKMTASLKSLFVQRMTMAVSQEEQHIVPGSGDLPLIITDKILSAQTGYHLSIIDQEGITLRSFLEQSGRNYTIFQNKSKASFLAFSHISSLPTASDAAVYQPPS